MSSDIYNLINQEMKYCEICLDMAKRHVEDVLLTLTIVDDQQIPAADVGVIDREYLQELNRQISEISTRLGAWEHIPQPASPESD